MNLYLRAFLFLLGFGFLYNLKYLKLFKAMINIDFVYALIWILNQVAVYEFFDKFFVFGILCDN